MVELLEVGNEIDCQWDQIASSHTSGTIYHTTKWLKIISTNQSLKTIRFGIYIDENLVGIFPIFLKRFLFIKVVGSPFVVEDTPYLGPVIDNGHISSVFSAFDNYLRRNRISFFRTISKQLYPVENRLQSYHFFREHTHLLDITQSEENLWKNLEGRCRTAIRKATKSGVNVTVETNRSYIDEYYSILETVYSDQGMPCPNKKSFYYDIWASFVPDNAMFLSAQYAHEIIAGIIIIFDRNRAYYLNGASKQRFRSLSPTNLLLWQAIRLAKERGVDEFDFVGSDIPRLAKFKKSFGGQVIEYSLIEKASSPWVYRLRKRYPYYKQKIGKLRSVFENMSLR